MKNIVIKNACKIFFVDNVNQVSKTAILYNIYVN